MERTRPSRMSEWKLAFQIARRMFFSQGQIWTVPNLISLFGISLGVACLMTAMGVVSGFETTLKGAITEVAGDVVVLRRTTRQTSREAFIETMRKRAPEIVAATPFVRLEGVIAGGGKSAGVMFEGLDSGTAHQVLKLQRRVVTGSFDIDTMDGQVPSAVVGKRLAKLFDLKVGEKFRVVVPVPSKTDASRFDTRLQTFVLRGTLDLGKVEYDERSIVTNIGVVQKLGDVGDNVSGWRLKLESSDQAMAVAMALSGLEGIWTMTWLDINANLFEAIRIEKPVIFFVIMVMIVAAAFNVATQLFVSVVARYSEVSILRALGLSTGLVKKLFIWQGLLMAGMGASMGFCLGAVFLTLFQLVQKWFVILPGDTYKIDAITVDVRFFDLLAVLAATFLICWLATLIPASRAAKLNPIEGLRYE